MTIPPFDLGVFREASRSFGEYVIPVLDVEEGTARATPHGSACILQLADSGYVVTADHVVNGPTPKRTILKPNGVDTWPRPYMRIIPRESSIGEADLAYARGQLPTDEPYGITPQMIAPELPLAPGTSCVVIGFPNSRGSVRGYRAQYSSDRFFVVLQTVSTPALPDFRFDERVHIALSYDRAEMRTVEGERQTGADPHGMSGGALCVGFEVDRRVHLKIVGIVTRFYDAPHNIVIASRIECLLDAIGPSRPLERRTHDSAVSGLSG
jgi:hypothetical protein